MIASKGLLLIVVTWSRPVGRMLRLSDLPIGSIGKPVDCLHIMNVSIYWMLIVLRPVDKNSSRQRYTAPYPR